MEAVFIVLIVVAAIVGVGVGMIIGRPTKIPNETNGVIYVNYNSPHDTPELFLEVHVPVETIASQKKAVFDVGVLGQNSQK